MIHSVECFFQVDKNAGLKSIRTVVDVVHKIHYAMDGFGSCSKPKLGFAEDKFVEVFVYLVICNFLKYFAKYAEK